MYRLIYNKRWLFTPAFIAKCWRPFFYVLRNHPDNSINSCIRMMVFYNIRFDTFIGFVENCQFHTFCKLRILRSRETVDKQKYIILMIFTNLFQPPKFSEYNLQKKMTFEDLVGRGVHNTPKIIVNISEQPKNK